MIVLPLFFGFLSLVAAQDDVATSQNVTTETLALRYVTQSGPKSRPLPLATSTKTPKLTTSDISTITATNISTSFITETVLSTTSATIQPSSSFVPIQSIIALDGGVPGKKRDDIYARAKKPAAQMVLQENGTTVVTPRQYPVRVRCLKVLYVTVTRFRNVIAPAETITTSALSTTIRVTLTYGLSSTVVTAATTPIYSTFPTPYYAACGRSNIARSMDDVPIGAVGVKNSFGTLAANTPYNCCVRGIQGEYGSTFFQKGGCFLIAQAVPAICDAEEQAFTFNSVATLDASHGIVLSNGNCGQGQLVPEPPRG